MSAIECRSLTKHYGDVASGRMDLTLSAPVARRDVVRFHRADLSG